MADVRTHRRRLSLAIHSALASTALGLAIPTSAQPSFEERLISDSAFGARSIIAVDLDQDGDMDAVSASIADEKIAWYENNGRQGFTLRTIALDALLARFAFPVDVDSDGDIDVVVATTNVISWFENDGAQNFTRRTISQNIINGIAVFAVDLDGDGDTDVLSVSAGDNLVAWYENDGSEIFTQRTVSTLAEVPLSVFAADVDGDGDVDVLSASVADNKIAWYENDGSENFTVRTITTNALGARQVFAVDLDRDGDTDVLSGSADDSKLAWYENDGMQGFTLHTISTQADIFSVFARDLDGDGDLDVSSASYSANVVVWYENDGTQSFIRRTISTNIDGGRFVFAEDVDGDGDADLLAASQKTNSVLWYENSTRQSFPRFGNVPLATEADGVRSVFAIDMEGDGDLDLLSASLNDDTIAWLENDGSQALTRRIITTNADAATSVVAVDVDADGDIDVVSASYNDDKVAWYENDGNQNFTTRTISTSADGAIKVLATDLDRDGDIDVLSASRYDAKIAWYENDGSQGFTLRTIAIGLDSPGLFAADVNRDGNLDLLAVSFGESQVAWFENDGNQVFTERTISDEAQLPLSAFAIDVDRDGDVDVLSASFGDNKIAWYENDGNQVFTLRTITLDAQGARDVAASDLDGDGDIDVLSASITDDKVAWYENNGSQDFTLHTLTTSAIDARLVVTVDLDRDGDRDVLSASSGDDTITWHPNLMFHRSGAFSDERVISTTADNAFSVFASDLDGDGDTDVLSASYADNKIAWYENDGNQDFLLHTISTTASDARSVVAADVDGDGDQDVLSASRIDNKVAWYENDGNQNFLLHTISEDAFLAISVIADDLDGDGDNDVLATHTDSVVWFENDGNQGFTKRTISTIANSNSPRSVVTADVDSDGDTDVLSASTFDDRVNWYENDGDQNFTAHVIASDADGADSVFAVDLDGDGDIDVLSASRDDHKIAWYENDGQQNFSLHTISTNARRATSVLAADLDSDGDLDVASASFGDNKVAWYENDGSENFTVRTVTRAAAYAYSVFAADVDGDGDADLLSASIFNNTIAWYENQGGQFLVAGMPAVPGGTIFEGQTVDLLDILILHNGRPEDGQARLDAISLRFADAQGDSLNRAQAEALVNEIRVYLDNGDDVLNPVDDTLLISQSDFELTPAAYTRGNQTIRFDDGAVMIDPGQSARLFVSADLSADAASQTPDTFQVLLNQVPLPRSQASDAVFGTVLSLEAAINFSSGVITPQPVPDINLAAELPRPILLVDNDADGLPNPSDTVRFGVLLRNNGDAISGTPLTFELAAPSGTTVTRANFDGTLQGQITFDGQTISASFEELQGGGAEFVNLVTFDLLIDNDIVASQVQLQGTFGFGDELFLTDDPAIQGAVDVTQFSIGPLSRLEPDANAQEFGDSAAISESFVAVGSPGDNGGQGTVSIYRIDETGQREFVERISPPDGFDGTGFGTDVALDGDMLVIGSTDSAGAKGGAGNKAAVYRLLAANQPELVAQIQGNLASGFGAAVDIEGDTIVIGAPDEDEGTIVNAGAVYLFSMSALQSGNQAPAERIASASPGSEFRFGASVACNNGKVVIGAPGPTSSVFLGLASVYDVLTGNLADLATPAIAIGQFGAAVAVEGDNIVIGAPMTPGGGAVFEYDLSGNRIGDKLVGDDTSSGHDFGRAVALDGGELYVGAPAALTAGVNDAGQSNPGNFGAAYRFSSNQRTQMEKVGAFSRSSDVFGQQLGFGTALDVRNGALVVGAPQSQTGRGAAAFRSADSGEPPDPNRIFKDGFEG